MSFHKTFRIVIGLIISISLIVYLFYKIDFTSVKQAISNFKTVVFLVLLIVYVAGMFLRTLRWQLLISQQEDLRGLIVFKALTIGYMINNLLPAKVGELARMEYIQRKHSVGRSFLLGTIFIERIIDLLIVLLFFAFSLLFSQTSRAVISNNHWILFLMTGILILSVYFIIKPKAISWFIIGFPVKMKSKFEQILSSFAGALKFIKNRKILFPVSYLSIAIWGLTLLTAYSILWGLNITLPFYGYLFLVAAGVLGLVIPSTAGSIGVYHAIATGALVLLGITPEKALSYAIISHAFDFLPNVFLGIGVTINETIQYKQS
jgi:glycosyltransferase 2 family protein